MRTEVLQEEAVLCASKEVFANEPISRADRSLLMAYKVGVNCRRRQRSVDCNATVVLLTDRPNLTAATHSLANPALRGGPAARRIGLSGQSREKHDHGSFSRPLSGPPIRYHARHAGKAGQGFGCRSPRVLSRLRLPPLTMTTQMAEDRVDCLHLPPIHEGKVSSSLS